MNAKILLLFALVLTAMLSQAQVTPSTTNGLSHEDLLRRAVRARTAATEAASGADAPAATGADWSVTNSPRPAEVSGTAEAQPAAAKPEPVVVPAAPPIIFSGNTNRPGRNLPRQFAAPATPGVKPATVPASPASSAASTKPVLSSLPDAAGMTVSIRPPSDESTVPNPDTLMPAGGINWTSASLTDQVLPIYTELVGRNLLRPATLPKVEIVLKQTTPLTKLEVVRMIEAAMYLNQISVVNVGDKFVTVVPTAEAFKIPGVIGTNEFGSMPVLGSIVTHIVQLKYTKPGELVQILTPFASGTAANPIMPVDSSGILVLRDNVANVKRMLEMIEKVDQVAQSEIISEVIPIKYAKAEEIASALSSVGGGSGGTVGTRATSSGTTGATRPGGLPGYNQPGGVPGQPGATPTPSSGSTFGDRVQNILRKAASSGDLTILGTTKIIADIRSNSLLVFASRQDMEMIKDIIGKLDVVLSQVLIETIIMDVSFGDNWELGISAAQNQKTVGNATGLGGFNNGNPFFNFLNSATNVYPGNFTSTLPGGVNYFGKLGVGPSIEVALKAAADDSRVNVIQKPRIQTSHATPASIFIGQTVPYISGTYNNYGGGNSSSYQQLRVGIGLNVTPFINQEGLVVMKIEETIDEIGDSVTIDGNPIPKTKSSTLSAEIAVRDKDTIMLGGIIRNSDDQSKSGVPLLKDIPLLGRLFSSSKSKKSRQELIVLMRPTVLYTPAQAAAQVNVEKQRLPGVREAEKDLDKVELSRANKDRKDRKSAASSQSDFNRATPFTPEEEKMLLVPPPPAAP